MVNYGTVKMYVELEYLKFKNVLSYGAKEITHTFEPGLTAISGRNGTGKSTFLEVISYNWFGKPYRKIKLDALINRENKKGLETETCVCIDHKDRYRIIRNMKPNRLQILKNDHPYEMLSSKILDQEDITKILGIDYKMFKQIVSLAVTYNKPFLTQEAAEKREIVESIFNIKIIGEMLDVLKKKISTEKVKYTVNKKTVEMLEENINIMRKNIIEVKKSVTEFEAAKASDLIKTDSDIKEIAGEITRLNNEITKIADFISSLETRKDTLTAEIVERELSLSALTTADDTTSPEAIQLTAEVKVLADELADVSARLTAIEGTEAALPDDQPYKNLLAERDADIEKGIKLKDQLGIQEKYSLIDYNADPEYRTLSESLIPLTSTQETQEVTLNTMLSGMPVADRMKAMNVTRDKLLREKNDCDRTTRNELEYIEYLKTNDVCKKCKTKITEEFKAQELKNSYASLDADALEIARLNVQIKETDDIISGINNLAAAIAETKRKVADAQVALTTRQIFLDNEHQKKISDIKNEMLLLKSKIQAATAAIDTRIKDIQNEHQKKISGLKTKQTNIELSKNIKQTTLDNIKKERIRKAEAEIFAVKSEIDKIKINIENETNNTARCKKTIETSTEQLKKLEARKIEIQERKSTFDLPALEKEFAVKISDFKTAYAENGAMAEKLKVYDITANMLSEEGIKSFFFRRLTPILNAKINEYLDKFDIPVRCQFNEQMEEKIYNIGNENELVSYYSYSEGEKKSIDIAILMSFIDITKTICNWFCNILLIDELIDGQVDFARLEKMFECLREFSGSGRISSIYIVSHRQLDDIQSFFKRIITVNKVDGFSEITSRKM
jgi:DNA repair exonuclease SbcCD ATPase subunit